MGKNIISLLIGNGIAQLISFIVVIIIARIFTEINVINKIIKRY